MPTSGSSTTATRYQREHQELRYHHHRGRDHHQPPAVRGSIAHTRPASGDETITVDYSVDLRLVSDLVEAPVRESAI